MTLFLEEHQKAVIAALKAYSAIATDLRDATTNQVKVFDQGGAPASNPFPYITVGHATERRKNTFGVAGCLDDIQVNHWTQKAGFAEARKLSRYSYDALDNKTFSLGGGLVMVYCHFTGSVLIEEEEGSQRRVASTFEIFSQKP